MEIEDKIDDYVHAGGRKAYKEYLIESRKALNTISGKTNTLIQKFISAGDLDAKVNVLAGLCVMAVASALTSDTTTLSAANALANRAQKLAKVGGNEEVEDSNATSKTELSEDDLEKEMDEMIERLSDS